MAASGVAATGEVKMGVGAIAGAATRNRGCAGGAWPRGAMTIVASAGTTKLRNACAEAETPPRLTASSRKIARRSIETR